jgi:hypothetical protein
LKANAQGRIFTAAANIADEKAKSDGKRAQPGIIGE